MPTFALLTAFLIIAHQGNLYKRGEKVYKFLRCSRSCEISKYSCDRKENLLYWLWKGRVSMRCDCHIHMVLDGVSWKTAIARHEQAPAEDLIRQTLRTYQALGYTYLRDGGDRWGAGKRARELAPEFGITYRTSVPCRTVWYIYWRKVRKSPGISCLSEENEGTRCGFY